MQPTAFYPNVRLSIFRTSIWSIEKIDTAIARNSRLAQGVSESGLVESADLPRNAKGADVIEHAGKWGRGHIAKASDRKHRHEANRKTPKRCCSWHLHNA